MSDEQRKARKKRSDLRWGLIILAAMCTFPPAGVGLIIAKVLDFLPNIGGKTGTQKTGTEEQTDTRRKPMEEYNGTMKKRKGMPNGGQAICVFGIIAAVVGGALSLGALAALLNSFIPGNIILLTLALSLAVAGVTVAIFGKQRKEKKIRFVNYLKLIGDKQAISIHALADAAGTTYKHTLEDLKEMIVRNILNPAWLDMKKYRLMLSEYSESAQTPEPEETNEECLSRSARILRQIRADNDLIDDEQVSQKIDRIEDLTRKIFEIVERYPEKEKQLYSFLNYYLPTTLKSLESYARLEAQGIETESVRQAKEKINLMLDELADGYEKQLDKLFEDDVLDISADIEVMRQMLQRDGLTEDEITRK